MGDSYPQPMSNQCNMECPVCCCMIENSHLQRHVNHHLDEETISEDRQLAEAVAVASPAREVEYVMCNGGCGLNIPLTELESHLYLHEEELRLNAGSSSAGSLDVGNWVCSEQNYATKGKGAVVLSQLPSPWDARGLVASQQRERGFVPIEEGVMHLIKKCLLAEGQRYSACAITSYVDHFQSCPEDLGWGCGWRNIQMLSSYLITKEREWRNALFGGSGFVPNIPSLQQWQELAWSRGFDPSGAEHFNWNIYGSKKWIGTTECASLLRSFGVRAQIADFKGLTRKNGGKSSPPSKAVYTRTGTSRKRSEVAGNRPVKSSRCCGLLDMEVHGTRLMGPSCSSSSGGITTGCATSTRESEAAAADADAVNHQRLVDWVWSYYTDAEPSLSADALETATAPSVYVSSHPPIYFQHQGHSRTIVGMQRRRRHPGGPEEAFLLVLDPSQHTEDLAKALRVGVGWQKLIKRGVHTLKKAEYQLCYVAPGIAHGKEQEELKTLTSLTYLY